MSTRLLDFYWGKGVDSAGRSIDQILRMPVNELESTHDYIQWLFPLLTVSPFNPGAPLLDAQTVKAFREDAELRNRLIRSLRVLLTFYGLELDDADTDDIWVVPAPTFSGRSRVWLTPRNHNYLRLTRIMKSLALLGCRAYAHGLQRFLLDLYRKSGGKIGPETFKHWRDSVS